VSGVAGVGGAAGEAFTAADIANLTQSLVHLHVAPGPPLLSGLYSSFTTLLQQQQQLPQQQQQQKGRTDADGAGGVHVATMLWALGAFWRGNAECLWLRQHPQTIAALVTASQQHLGRYEPLQLRRCLVALAVMGYDPGRDWLAAHEAAVLGRVGVSWPKTLEQVLRGYRELGLGDTPGQGVLREALGHLQQQQQAQQGQQQ
jgi:hypothetical protein